MENNTNTGGKCPFTGATLQKSAGAGTKNQDWWPNQLDLSVLRQHSSLSDPMDPSFDYTKAFKSLDYIALKNDIKAVLFDMDGVLIDARDWHFQALNEALTPFGYQISYQNHISRFNGLSTNSKLKILSAEFNFPTSLHSIVNIIKQDRTLRIAGQLCFPNVKHQILLSRLNQKGILIGVVTNSIRNSAEALLSYANLSEFVYKYAHIEYE
mgnify:CR=1 FL=1